MIAATLLAMPASGGPAASPDMRPGTPGFGTRALLEDRLVLALARSPSLAGADLHAIIEEGSTVVLTGTVPSAAARLRAMRIAETTPGVAAVRDALEIRPTAADHDIAEAAVRDRTLARRIAVALADRTFPDASAAASWAYGWDVVGGSWRFSVDVDRGHVTLVGHVARPGDIRAAVEVVRDIPGVHSVQSYLVARDLESGVRSRR